MADLIYACVWVRDSSTVVAELAQYAGTFRAHLAVLMGDVDAAIRYGSYELEDAYASFHYLNADTLLFGLFAQSRVSQDSAFSFLNELYMQFFTVLGVDNAVSSADALIACLPLELNAALQPRICALMHKYTRLQHDASATLPHVALGSEGRAPVKLDMAHLESRAAAPLLVGSRLRFGPYTLASIAADDGLRAAALRSDVAEGGARRTSFLSRHPLFLVTFCSALCCLALAYSVLAIICGSEFEFCI